MDKKIREYIDTFEFLFEENIVILNNLYELIYKSAECNLNVLDEFTNRLKASKDKNQIFRFENGYKVKTSQIIIDENVYYIGLSGKIDSNPFDYEDPILKKISFFLDFIPDGIAILKNRQVIYRNQFVSNLIGLSKEDKDYSHYSNFMSGDDYNLIQEVLDNSGKGNLTLNLHTVSGESKWITISANAINTYDDIYHIISIKDVTNQAIESETYKSEKEYLKSTLESVKEGLIICDKNCKITLFNNVASLITGIPVEEALNQDVTNVLIAIDSMENSINYVTDQDFKNEDCLIFSNDGLFRHVSLASSNIIDMSGNTIGKVIIIIDISESKKREKDILYLSYHDILTGLYNRTYMDFEIKRLDTKRQLPFGIIMGDVNGLKITNDVFGHSVGDLLLKKVGEIMKCSCRQEDIIGRWGGDEFVILLPNTAEEEVLIVMKRIMRDFEELGNSDSIKGLLPNISLGYGIKTTMDESIYDSLKVAENNMYKRKMLSAESIHSSIITSMKTTLYEKSNETEDHSNRLYKHCVNIGKKYKLSDVDFDDLELLCLLHDIGKIGISDKILKKPGKLDEKEWFKMKRHSAIGFRIAQATPHLKKVSNYILYHHERFDGTGYPKGLKEYEIPLINRILSVADAYDAMTNDRSYRKAMSHEESILELQNNSGTQFDPEIVKIFIDDFKK